MAVGIALWAVAVRTRRPALRTAALAALIGLLYAWPQALLLATRPAHVSVADSLVLTEAAGARLLAGHDPYGHDYIDSAALRSVFLPELPVNPVLGHYVYMPGLALLAAAWRWLASGATLGWLWIPAQGCLALAARKCGRGDREKDALMIAAALNPALLLDYVSLFNDIFYLAAALAALALARRAQPLAAGLCLGLAVLFKQPAVLLAPAVLYGTWRVSGRRGAVQAAAAALAAGAAGVLPFLLAGAAAFLGDVAGYFYSSGAQGYPIRGPGVGGLLLWSGLLPSRWGAFPAAALELIAGGAVLALAARSLQRHWSWPRLWAWTGAFALAVFATGRTSAPNYVDVAALLWSMAIASALEGADDPAAAEQDGLSAGQQGEQAGPARC